MGACSPSIQKLPAAEKQDDDDCSSSRVGLLADLRRKYEHQPIFLQAVEEMALSLEPLFYDTDRGDFYKRAFLIMVEPERAWALYSVHTTIKCCIKIGISCLTSHIFFVMMEFMFFSILLA